MASHHALDLSQVFGVYGGFQLAHLAEGFDMRFQFGPAREPVLAGDLELGLREGLRVPPAEEILGLEPQVTQVWTFGQGRHSDLLSSFARGPHRA
jgi:hypothetical protein